MSKVKTAFLSVCKKRKMLRMNALLSEKAVVDNASVGKIIACWLIKYYFLKYIKPLYI